MFTYLKKLWDGLVTVKDPHPEMGLNREWRRSFGISYFDGVISFGPEVILTKMKGKQLDTECIVKALDFCFNLNILEWRWFSATHDWYDGPICDWSFGPFALVSFKWFDCTKGLND